MGLKFVSGVDFLEKVYLFRLDISKTLLCPFDFCSPDVHVLSPSQPESFNTVTPRIQHVIYHAVSASNVAVQSKSPSLTFRPPNEGNPLFKQRVREAAIQQYAIHQDCVYNYYGKKYGAQGWDP